MQRRIIIGEQDTEFQVNESYAKNYVTSKKMKSADFIDMFQDENYVLPQHTKFHKKYSNSNYIFVTETPSHMRTITMDFAPSYRWRQFKKWCTEVKAKDGPKYFQNKFKRKTFDYTRYRFHLLFPYLINVILVNSETRYFIYRIYVRKNPLTKISDRLYHAPFYNIHDGARVCMGNFPEGTANDRGTALKDKFNLSMLVNELTDYFLLNSFNSDYSSNIRRYKDSIFSNYFVWEYLSKFNPKYLYEQEFIQTTTMGETIAMCERSAFFSRWTSPVKKVEMFMPSKSIVRKERKVGSQF
ncbi:MAG: hypothetical protein ACTSX1_12025 [Candidatus Heimdallarchaeaceae archaeon]